MVRSWSRPLVIALALLASVAAARSSGLAQPPAQAPDIELRGPAGDVSRLAALVGRVVLVDFWASWCRPCEASFPVLDDLYRRRHGEGLEVLAINVDEERRDAERFLRTRPHEMPVFFDPKGRAPEAFRVEAMPSAYVLDRQGRIRFRHVGYTASSGSEYEREVQELLVEEAPIANP